MAGTRKILKRLTPRQWWRGTASDNHPAASGKCTKNQTKMVEKDESITEKEGIGDQRMSRFLRETPICREVALFDLSEIRIGNLLGAGSFCDVFEVRRIRLQSGLERSSQMSESFYNLSESNTETTEARRREIANTCTERDGKPKYALKQLTLDIPWFLPEDDFGCAATDLLYEARYLSRFDHANVLKVYGMSVDGQADHDVNGFFFIADRLTGTLDEQIQEWKRAGKGHHMGENVVVKTEYALQIANALGYLHERRIVLRDLKPKNIGFLPSGSSPGVAKRTIQLFDFGFCRELPEPVDHAENVFRMSKVGSPAYMAPEIFASDRRYNTKADVYSFAVVYLEMLVLKNSLGNPPRFQSMKGFAARGLRPDLKILDIPFGVKAILASSWRQSIPERISICEASSKIQNVLYELHHVQTRPKIGADQRLASSKTAMTEPSGSFR